MVRSRTLSALLLLAAGCASAVRPPPEVPPAPPEALESEAPAGRVGQEFADAPLDCQADAELRARVPDAVADGKLDRARRLVELANRLCREHAPQSWKHELEVLWALGRVADARRLAAIVLVEPEADDETLKLARDLRARVDPNPEPPEQLLQAGLAELRQGDPAAAQRLLDRARSALERQLGEPARLLVPRPETQWQAAAFSADAARVALANKEGALRVAELGAQPRARALPDLSKSNLISLAFSPDGSTLAAGANRSTVVYDLESARHELHVTAGWASWMEFRDARTLVSVETDGGSAWATVQPVDSSKRAPLIRLECYSQPIASLDGGQRLACRAADGITHRPGVAIYDLKSKKRVQFLDVSENIGMSGLVPLERLGVFVAGGFGNLGVFELKTGSERGAFKGYAGQARSFAVHPQGDRVLVGGGTRSGQLGLYDVGRLLAGAKAESAQLEQARLEGPALLAVGFAGGERIVSMAADGVITERKLDFSETLRLVPAWDDFVVVAPSGEAQVPEAALAAVRCQIGEQTFDVALCRERFIVPNLLQALRSGRAYDP